MPKLLLRTLSAGVLCLCGLTGCENFFGDKTDLDFIDVPEFQAREVAYVPIFPIIQDDPDPSDTNYFTPVSLAIGFDRLTYAVDAGNNRVVVFDASGRPVGSLPAPAPRTITLDGQPRTLLSRFTGGIVQDRKLDLLVVGTIDTVINNTFYTLATIFRYDLKGQGGYGPAEARVTNRVIHPFYLKQSVNTDDGRVRFRDVAILGDNRYYVTRNGPRANAFGGPDDAVLVFSADDARFSPVFVATGAGVLNNFFRDPLGITTTVQPPQLPQSNYPEDFYVTLADGATAFKVVGISVAVSDAGQSYVLIPPAPVDTTRADRYLYEPFRFSRPTDVTLTGDGTNFLFVVDETKDSLYQFTQAGLEGVPPPPGSINPTKVVPVSFGGGSGETDFNRPVAVAYDSRTVYVADILPDGRGRILRFRLTIDFD
ncbi:MAG: hypothetical protein WBA12_09380 [Catalinimonas sp.]